MLRLRCARCAGSQPRKRLLSAKAASSTWAGCEDRAVRAGSAHAEDLRGASADGAGAQDAHGLAAQLEAHQPAQGVVSGPHADVGQVQVPAPRQPLV